MRSLNFLICSERSGSNFITSLLNGHSRISAPPPTHLFRLFALNEHRYNPLSGTENWAHFQADVRQAFEAMPGQWNSEFPDAALEFDDRAPSIPEVLSRIYSAERRTDAADISFVKENYTYSFLDFLIRNWPNARFVFQVRDPRDMALSLFKTANMAGGIVEATEQWLTDQTATMRVIEILSPDRLMRVRYEDLLDDTLIWCEHLCQHLGVDPDPEMLNFHTAPRTVANANLMTPWENLSKGVLKDNQRKFLKHLTADEIRYVELRCANLMKTFGYTLVSDAATIPQADRDRLAKVLEGTIRQPKAAIPNSLEDQQMRERRRLLIARVTSRQSGMTMEGPQT